MNVRAILAIFLYLGTVVFGAFPASAKLNSASQIRCPIPACCARAPMPGCCRKQTSTNSIQTTTIETCRCQLQSAPQPSLALEPRFRPECLPVEAIFEPSILESVDCLSLPAPSVIASDSGPPIARGLTADTGRSPPQA